MFGLKGIAIVGIAGLLLSGIAYIKGRSDGKDAENTRWTALAAQQKADASKILADETARVLEAERRLHEATNKIEADHVSATNAIAAASSKYARLGLLYERTKARCGSGGDSAPSPAASDASLNNGGVRSGENVSGPSDRDTFGSIASDADRLREAVIACQAVGATNAR